MDCTNSLGNRVYSSGSGPTYKTEKAKTNLKCADGFMWNNGDAGSVTKLATCTNVNVYAGGFGKWLTNQDCVCMPLYSLLRTDLINYYFLIL